MKRGLVGLLRDARGMTAAETIVVGGCLLGACCVFLPPIARAEIAHGGELAVLISRCGGHGGTGPAGTDVAKGFPVHDPAGTDVAKGFPVHDPVGTDVAKGFQIP